MCGALSLAGESGSLSVSTGAAGGNGTSATASPNGSSPTVIGEPITVLVAVSITDTEPAPEFVT